MASSSEPGLHLVVSTAALADALACARPGDAVLLLQDGVIALAGHPAPPRPELRWHVLAPDLAARGLPVPAGCAPVDDTGFVALAAAHSRCLTWY